MSNVIIKINGKTTEIKEPLTIRGLLEEKGIKPGEIVIQYNGDIIDKNRWPEILLKENDELEILRFVGGG